MTISELDGCSFSRDGLKGRVKSPIIWGLKGSIMFPLCYLRKPSSLDDREWEEFLDCFKFELKETP